MQYNLMFSLLGMFLTMMMLIVYFVKRREKTIQSRFYVGLIFSAMLYAIFDFLTVYFLYKFGVSSELLRITWNTRNAVLYVYIFTFAWYLNVLVKESSYKNIFEYFKKPVPLFFLILLFIINVFSIRGGRFPNFTIEKLDFTGGSGFNSTIVITLSCCFVGLYYGFKFRKDRKYILNTFLIILALLLITFFFQLRFIYVSFMPFISMVIILIIYYNIENPDIALLKNVTILKNKIDKSANAKTDFLFNLSYDLINPMNAIVSLSQSLKSMSIENKDEIFRDLKNIKYAGNTLLDSLDSILDLSEMGDEENKINGKEYSVYELFKKIESVALSRIGSKQVKFEMNVDDNISSRLYGDVAKVQSVLINVVNNACIYTDIGKVMFNVNFEDDKDNQILHFKIQDTGCGIKEENLLTIFENGQNMSKLGLGLSKKFIESMGGNIRVESVFGAGTTVFIDLPQKRVGNRFIIDDKNRDNVNDVIQYLDCSQYKMLICDDDNLDIKVTKKILEKYKFQISYVTDPMECIKKIKSGEIYDVLLLDYKMPLMDGMSVLKAIKSLENYNLPKIIVFTANAVTGACEYYIGNGFDEYLSKPIDIHELDRIINSFFKK